MAILWLESSSDKRKLFYFSIFQNMGDLATEIEQMQNDIHAFDEEIDALEQWVFKKD